MNKFLLLAILTLYASNANAGFLSGEDLYKFLHAADPDKAEPEYRSRYQALGYIQGVFDVYATQGVICPPHGVSGEDIVGTVRLHTDGRLDEKGMAWMRDVGADSLVSAAFLVRWKCPE